jgi:hypothetical protein
VELAGGDNLREIIHVLWLEVNDVEGMLGVLKIPKIDSKIIRGDEVLTI